MPPSDFQHFFEVATGPCKNAVNLACGHFLSSLFSLLSFLCSLPSSLLGPDRFLYHPALLGPCKNVVNLACGDFLSSLFSLLSLLFSLLSSSSLLGADRFLSHPAGPGPLANPVVSQLLLFQKLPLGISGGPTKLSLTKPMSES